MTATSTPQDDPATPGAAPHPPELVPPMAARAEHLAAMTSADAGVREAAMAAWNAPHGPLEAAAVTTEDTVIAGPHGRIPLRIYRPDGGGAGERLGVLWCHGGGFVGGDLDMPESEDVGRGLAARLDAVVVCVDYRLAPLPEATAQEEARRRAERWGLGEDDPVIRAPQPGQDVEAALGWMEAGAPALGIDPARIAVGGASAGGALAAALAQQRAVAGRPLWATLLAYPLVHPQIPAPQGEEAAALAAVPAALGFSPELVDLLGAAYLGTADAGPREFAGLAEPAQMARLGRTYIEVDEIDDLRPSGRAYAQQLAAAGVPVTLEVRRGVPHGHLNHRGLPAARESLDRMARFVREA